MPLPRLLAILSLCGCCFLASGVRAQNVANAWDVGPNGAPGFAGGVVHHPFTDRVWVADALGTALVEYSRSGTELRTVPTRPLNPGPFHQIIGLSVDDQTGELILADESEDLIFWDPMSGLVNKKFSVLGFCSELSGVTLDSARSEIYLVNDLTREVVVCDTNGAYHRRFSLLAHGVIDPDGVCFLPWGNLGFGSLLIGDDFLDTVFEVSLDGSQLLSQFRVPFQSGFLSPEGLGIDPVSGSLFLGDGNVSSKVFEVGSLDGPCAGGIRVYGDACRDDGGGAPAVRVDFAGAARRCPRPGMWMVFEATTTSSATHGGLIFGVSDQIYRGLNLPFDLTPVGAPGCSIYASPEILFTGSPISLATRGPGKVLRVPTFVPNLPLLSGRSIYLQSYFGPDRLRPSHQLAWSHGLEITFE